MCVAGVGCVGEADWADGDIGRCGQSSFRGGFAGIRGTSSAQCHLTFQVHVPWLFMFGL